MQCDMCGSAVAEVHIGGSSFRECVDCGYGLLDASVPSEYWSETPQDVSKFWVDAKKSYFESALEIIEALAIGRSLVDIGGGIGYFSELAVSRRWDAYSVDVSPIATGLAAERLGRDRALLDLDEIEAGNFDVATMWCVIAHTRDPATLLSSVRRVLRPDGVLWLTTPNFTFQKAYSRLRAVAQKPMNFAAEGHVAHFTTTALQELLLRCGFSQPRLHFAGVTAVCGRTVGNQLLTRAKRAYNKASFALATNTGMNYVSELQVTARVVEPHLPRKQ